MGLSNGLTPSDIQALPEPIVSKPYLTIWRHDANGFMDHDELNLHEYLLVLYLIFNIAWWYLCVTFLQVI